MAIITTKIEQDNDLTLFTVEGDLSADEILKYSLKYYEKHPTKLVLWDASNGTVKNIANSEFSRIASIMKDHTAKRAGGKTALVGKFAVDFGTAHV